MRIVSLLPAATEWLAAFGALDDLVARSHACNAPPAVRTLPAVTRTAVEGGDTRGINAAMKAGVRERLGSGLSMFEVDLGRLRALEPDLVVTQASCDVCAVPRSQLEAELAAWTGTQPALFSMEPSTFKEVLDAALRLGRAVGRAGEAMRVVGQGERRLHALRTRLGLSRRTDPGTLPTVACIEWLDPLMTAGHWTPDVVELAGGRAVLASSGAPSPVVDWDALRAADPDVIVVAPCGFSVEETRRDMHLLAERPGWRDLRAVCAGRVHLLDGRAYLTRPGPRLYRAAELLAAAIASETAAGNE